MPNYPKRGKNVFFNCSKLLFFFSSNALPPHICIRFLSHIRFLNQCFQNPHLKLPAILHTFTEKFLLCLCMGVCILPTLSIICIPLHCRTDSHVCCHASSGGHLQYGDTDAKRYCYCRYQALPSAHSALVARQLQAKDNQSPGS